VILHDNLRNAVLERRGNQIHFHPRLLELCAHYHCIARPCPVRAGNRKGRVERGKSYTRRERFIDTWLKKGTDWFASAPAPRLFCAKK